MFVCVWSLLMCVVLIFFDLGCLGIGMLLGKLDTKAAAIGTYRRYSTTNPAVERGYTHPCFPQHLHQQPYAQRPLRCPLVFVLRVHCCTAVQSERHSPRTCLHVCFCIVPLPFVLYSSFPFSLYISLDPDHSLRARNDQPMTPMKTIKAVWGGMPGYRGCSCFTSGYTTSLLATRAFESENTFVCFLTLS